MRAGDAGMAGHIRGKRQVRDRISGVDGAVRVADHVQFRRAGDRLDVQELRFKAGRLVGGAVHAVHRGDVHLRSLVPKGLGNAVPVVDDAQDLRRRAHPVRQNDRVLGGALWRRSAGKRRRAKREHERNGYQ